MHNSAAQAAFDSPFHSFFMGGFECSTKKFWDGRRIDVIGKTQHDLRAKEDYCLLHRVNVRAVRDGLRWHLIEQTPGVYDWSSWDYMVEASLEVGTQVIWDLCHYGVPDYLTDIYNGGLVERFADFATAAAERFKRLAGPETIPFWCPINEISFWTHNATAGAQPFMWPSTPGRGPDLKRLLVKAAIDASRRVLAVDSRARLVQVDPISHITTLHGDTSESRTIANAKYEAWDMLSGRMAPELGGSPELLDIIGCNFYSDSEWRLEAPQTVELGFRHYRPLSSLLKEVHDRYNCPIIVSETGAEGSNGAPWMSAMGYEARQAINQNVPLFGVCIYPVIDYSGWDNDRHCRTGLISLAEGFMNPSYDKEMLRSLLEQAQLLSLAPQFESQVNALVMAAEPVKTAA